MIQWAERRSEKKGTGLHLEAKCLKEKKVPEKKVPDTFGRYRRKRYRTPSDA
jgi:hypothetical protein